MRIHYLQHANFEGPAAIVDWAAKAGHSIAGSHLYRGDGLPELSSFDLLIILGGPMSVNDEQQHAWLIEEKRLVRKAVEAERSIFGVCLSAQMIASAFGAHVYRAAQKEIGWFPARRVTTEGVGALFPETFTPLHWHGETFDLPHGAIRLVETDAVPNQAFQLGKNVVGLQFHIEATVKSVQMLIENAAHEIQPGKPFQQPVEEIRARTPQASADVLPVLRRLLDRLADTKNSSDPTFC